MYEQIDFRFRCQVRINSLHGTLVKYLQSKHTEFPREQMILWSLSAFWYPLACKWQGDLCEAQLKHQARNAVYQLQQQINYLVQLFGLDTEELVTQGERYGGSIGSRRFKTLAHEDAQEGTELKMTDADTVDVSPSAMPLHAIPSSTESSLEVKLFSPTEVANNLKTPMETETDQFTAANAGLTRNPDDDVLDEAFKN